MEGKKISFGFMKTKTVHKTTEAEKKDYIDCLEEKSIKIIGGESIQESAPLVIPMKPNTLVTAERLKQIAEEVEKVVEEPDKNESSNNDIKEQNLPESETLDQMAVRELLQDAKKEISVETPVLTLAINPDKLVLEGQIESTLEDYEAVPIQDFGMAMLRGMGWAPGKEQSKYKQPQLRPKGLGLGADKVVKENQKKNASKDKDEELSIVKNSFVKILVGKYSGYYGKVQKQYNPCSILVAISRCTLGHKKSELQGYRYVIGQCLQNYNPTISLIFWVVSLDEENGRVMVDIAVKKETVSLSEFMMQPVTKSEFDKQSRVINSDMLEEDMKDVIGFNLHLNSSSRRDADKYEEYKKNETLSRHHSPKIKDNEPSSSQKSHKDDKKDYRSQHNSENSSNGRNKHRDRRNDSPNSEDRSRRKKREKKNKYSSNESIDSLSESEKDHKRNRKNLSSGDSKYSNSKTYKNNNSDRSLTPEMKRDIDKKRKGKKKRRDRDRSPNYRKHKNKSHEK